MIVKILAFFRVLLMSDASRDDKIKRDPSRRRRRGTRNGKVDESSLFYLFGLFCSFCLLSRLEATRIGV